ncbi:MAG: transcriptional repressor [Candidatus Absconditabacterales bacterium]
MITTSQSMFIQLAQQKLQEALYKLTKPRLQVIEYFANHTKAVSPYDIAKDQSDLDVVSIYRTIEILESLGLVHKIWSLGGYVRCDLSENHCQSDCCHEFQVCTQCHEYNEIHGHHKHSSGTSSTFATKQHISEQLGLCEKCNKTAVLQ